MFSRDGKVKSIEFQILNSKPPLMVEDGISSDELDYEKVEMCQDIQAEILKKKKKIRKIIQPVFEEEKRNQEERLRILKVFNSQNKQQAKNTLKQIRQEMIFQESRHQS